MNQWNLIFLIIELNLSHLYPPGLGSILEILSSFGFLHKMSPYVLEDIFGGNREDWTEEEYAKVLATGYALFFHFPAAMQPILGNIFHQTLKVRNHALHLKVKTYYNLLKQSALK